MPRARFGGTLTVIPALTGGDITQYDLSAVTIVSDVTIDTWALVTPAGSSASLSGSGLSRSFTPDLAGTYLVRATKGAVTATTYIVIPRFAWTLDLSGVSAHNLLTTPLTRNGVVLSSSAAAATSITADAATGIRVVSSGSGVNAIVLSVDEVYPGWKIGDRLLVESRQDFDSWSNALQESQVRVAWDSSGDFADIHNYYNAGSRYTQARFNANSTGLVYGEVSTGAIQRYGLSVCDLSAQARYGTGSGLAAGWSSLTALARGQGSTWAAGLRPDSAIAENRLAADTQVQCRCDARGAGKTWTLSALRISVLPADSVRIS